MLCTKCNQDKPHDPTKPPRTKAYGFYDYLCWDCHKERTIANLHKRNSLESPELKALQEQLQETQTKVLAIKSLMLQEQFRLKEVCKQNKAHVQAVKTLSPQSTLNIPYRILKAQVQSALDLLEQRNLEVPSPEALAHKASLQDRLERIQHKIKLFGPNAFDFKPKAPRKSAHDYDD